MNRRGCYCDLWEKNPAALEAAGVPRDHCGSCQTCGRPGHIRHFPGPVPFTGSWCDFHFRLVSFFHPLGFPGTMLYIAHIAGVILWLVFGR